MLHRAQRDISDYSKNTSPLIRHEATYSLNTRPRGESVCSVCRLLTSKPLTRGQTNMAYG